jgi:hypothetical protein
MEVIMTDAVTTVAQTDATTAPAPETASPADSSTPAQVAAPDEPRQFYDPKDVPVELQDSYKRMQGSYTKKMQEISSFAKEHRQKVEAYDNFMRDPVGTMQQLAAQQGYRLTKAEAAAAAAQAATEFQPKTWDDVISRAKSEAKQELLAELQPFMSEIRNTKRSQIETALDSEYPEWRAHEEDMVKLINQHPTLASDPAMLVRLAIPKEVMESKATQAALEKLRKKTEANKATSGSTTTKMATDTKPGVFKDINEAVAFAKERLRREGQRA